MLLIQWSVHEDRLYIPDDDKILLEGESNLDVTLLVHTHRDKVVKGVRIDVLVKCERRLPTNRLGDIDDRVDNCVLWRRCRVY